MPLHQIAQPIVFGPPGNSPYPKADAAPPVLKQVGVPVTGVNQIETATAAGTASATGTAIVTVTSNLFDAPVAVNVPITNTDNATAIGGKIRAAVAANNTIIEHFTVSGSTTAVVLTARKNAANDATLNIAIATGTATGVTAVPTSANTTSGVLGTAGILGQEIIVYNNAGVFSNVYKLVDDEPPTWKPITFAS